VTARFLFTKFEVPIELKKKNAENKKNANKHPNSNLQSNEIKLHFGRDAAERIEKSDTHQVCLRSRS